MDSKEFLKSLKKIARRRGVELRVDTHHGKGAHVRVYYGTRHTILVTGRRDIPKGLLRAMLKQLKIAPKDF